MSKDTFWFRHDSNAKDDPKCILLIEQLGPEGYGIFWILIELLREQPDYKYPLKLLPSIARRYNTSSEKIKTVISAYELFTVEQDAFFFSESLLKRMEALDDYKKALSEAGRRGAEARLKGGLSQAKRIELNGTEKNGEDLNGVDAKHIGEYSKDCKYIVISPKDPNAFKYRINGKAGLTEYFDMNGSIINFPQDIDRFMREKNGAFFNDFMHVFNTFQKFVKNQNK